MRRARLAALVAAALAAAVLPVLVTAHFNPAGPGSHSSAVDWWLWQAEESVKVRKGCAVFRFFLEAFAAVAPPHRATPTPLG